MGGMLELLQKSPILYFMIVFQVIFSVCCHEYLHAQMALWQGDPTAARAGHLTLNPLRQMGATSIVICCLIGFAFGSVPVNPALLKRRYSEALVAFAGPLANLLIALLFSFITALAKVMNCSDSILIFFYYGACLNIVLFLLNMLPFPILDGGKVFSYILPFPATFNKINPELKNGLTVFLFFAIFFCFDVIWRIGYFLTNNLIGLFKYFL
jgi:Zn-dependent protease